MAKNIVRFTTEWLLHGVTSKSFSNAGVNYRYWTIAYWTLFICWTVGAGLFMARYHGGFLTNYLSDITFPPWFYIHIRGLNKENGEIPNLIFVKKWFGLTPERAAISIFIVGVVSELKTMIWPSGVVTGTYDIYDILAYVVGLLICYIIDKYVNR